MSTLKKWITSRRDTDVVSKEDLSLPKRMTGFGVRYYYLTAHACMCERARSQGGAGNLKKQRSSSRAKSHES